MSSDVGQQGSPWLQYFLSSKEAATNVRAVRTSVDSFPPIPSEKNKKGKKKKKGGGGGGGGKRRGESAKVDY
jgi:hypothetical protein